MLKTIIKSFKIILKPFARLISKIIVWIIIFIKSYTSGLNNNSIPVLVANLCFNNSLVFKINPKDLKYHISDPDKTPERIFVWAGDWDKKIIPIEKHEKFFMIHELFIKRIEAENTNFYRYAIRQANDGKPLKRGNLLLDSRENIIAYFNKQRLLFEKIQKNGFDYKLAPEAGIVIGRDGKIIHIRQGHHTTAMAQILQLKEIKVRIRAVHSKWLEKQIIGQRFFLLKAIEKGFKELIPK